MKKEPQKKVSLALPESLYDQLKLLAQENGYTLPGYIRQRLKIHIRELEKDA